MKYTNILEKLTCMTNIIKSNWFYLAFLIITVFYLLLLNRKKISTRTCFILTLINYLLLLGYTIFIYNKELGTIGNSLIDNLFTNIYFPSAYVYLFILIVIDITTFVSLMNWKVDKVYKYIHSTFFFIFQFILTLILELLSKNKIDIFSKTSLFSNKDLVMLLELSVNVFMIWLVVIIFTYLTNIITEKVTLASTKKMISEEKEDIAANMSDLTKDIDLTPDYLTQVPALEQKEFIETTTTPENKFIPVTLINNNINKVPTPIVEPYTMIPNNNIVINTEQIKPEPIPNMNVVSAEKTNDFILNDFIPKKQETIIPVPLTNDMIFEKILNNDLPIIREEKEETNNYTLNDYRIFNKMLHEIKEHNQNNTITIDKDLEYRLITKYSTETFNMFKKMLKIYSN